MLDESSEQGIHALDVTAVAASGEGQGEQVTKGCIGEGVGFQVRPKVFGRIEFGGIGREEDRMQARRACNEVLGLGRAVRVETIPQQNDVAGEVAQQLAQEGNDFRAADVRRRMKAEIEVEPISAGGHANGRHHGDLLMMTGAMTQDRCLPTRAPGSAQDGSHQDAAFIEENKMGVQPAGFFLARGQSVRIQFWI